MFLFVVPCVAPSPVLSTKNIFRKRFEYKKYIQKEIREYFYK